MLERDPQRRIESALLYEELTVTLLKHLKFDYFLVNLFIFFKQYNKDARQCLKDAK